MQKAAVGQINAAVVQLNQTTQQNAASSEELAATSEEMSAQAEQLQQTMSFFKLGGAPSIPSRRAEPAKAERYRQTDRAQERVSPIKLASHMTASGDAAPDEIWRNVTVLAREHSDTRSAQQRYTYRP
jgi:methyl-accepting chemotaxis protein